MIQDKESKRLGQTVIRLALPVLIEQFCIVIMGIVNTMLAANLGKEIISAIGMIDTISMIIISVFSALAVGGTVVVAQYTGHDEPEMANQAAIQALLSCLVIAGLITLVIQVFQEPIVRLLFGQAEPQVVAYGLAYLSIILWSYLPIALVNIAFGILRGAGDTRTPMKVSILMNILNVAFSYFLIYGIHFNSGAITLEISGLGVRGAAIGLTLARVFGAALVLIPLFRGSKQIKLGKLRSFKIQPEMLRKIFSLGIPASAEQLMFNGGKLIVQTFVVSLGTVAIAANTIAGSINSLMMIPGNGLAIAATTLVGQQIGRGQATQARKQINFLIGASSAAMAVMTIILLPLIRTIAGLYTKDPATIDLTIILLISCLIAQPFFWATSFIAPAGLRGAGDVRFTMIVAMFSMGFMRIILGYVFAILLPIGVLGIWLAMYADWICRSIFFVLRIRGSQWLDKSVIKVTDWQC